MPNRKFKTFRLTFNVVGGQTHYDGELVVGKEEFKAVSKKSAVRTLPARCLRIAAKLSKNHGIGMGMWPTELCEVVQREITREVAFPSVPHTIWHRGH